DGDVGGAQARRRRHVVDAGDRRELFLERRRDRGGHGLRTRARKARADGQRWIVDRRKIAHRQALVGRDAEEQNPEHHQHRRDGPPNEQFREVHRSAFFYFTSTRAFGVKRDCPSITTCSPSAMPLSMVVRSPTGRPTEIEPTLATRSLPTTNT